MIELFLFWVCVLLTVAGALGATAVRNLFHAALLLGLTLVGIAGLYLFLEAAYLACIQVVVYVGGILVLVLFATLFSADILGQVQRARSWMITAGVGAGLLALLVALRLGQLALQHGVGLQAQRRMPRAGDDPIAGPTHSLGEVFVGAWWVAFLAAGLLLTVALVGAVATVQRFRKPVEVSHG